MWWLGIDTSCDDTGVGLFNDTTKAMLHLTKSHIFEKYGGVVPELAARDHVRSLPVLTQEILAKAGILLQDIGAIAVTVGPGFEVCLGVGHSFCQGLAYSGAMLYPMHHIESHILLGVHSENITPPLLVLVVSGAHTKLLYCKEIGHYLELGNTKDDAVGECGDKIAREMFGVFPGGALLEKKALMGVVQKNILPIPMLHHKGCDFSFSGLKQATRDVINRGIFSNEDLCATYHFVVAESLMHSIRNGLKILKSYNLPVEYLLITGGVSANRILRQYLASGISSLKVCAVSPHLATDNGVMVAVAASYRYSHNLPPYPDNISSSLPMDKVYFAFS